MDLATPLGGDAGRQYRADAEAKFSSAVSAAMAQDGNQRQMGRQRMARSAQARHTFYSGDPYWRYR